jgi:hypothetical protein
LEATNDQQLSCQRFSWLPFILEGMKLPTAASKSTTIALSPIGKNVESAVLIKFVRALAIRQARIDAGLRLAASKNEPRTLH